MTVSRFAESVADFDKVILRLTYIPDKTKFATAWEFMFGVTGQHFTIN